MTNAVTHVVIDSMPKSGFSIGDITGIAGIAISLIGLVVALVIICRDRKYFTIATKLNYLTHLVNQNERALQRLAKYNKLFPDQCYDADGFYLVPPEPRSLSKALERIREHKVILEKNLEGEKLAAGRESAILRLQNEINGVDLMIPHFEELISQRGELQTLCNLIPKFKESNNHKDDTPK